MPLVALGHPDPESYIINTDHIVTIINYGEDEYRIWMVGGEFRQVTKEQRSHVISVMGYVR